MVFSKCTLCVITSLTTAPAKRSGIRIGTSNMRGISQLSCAIRAALPVILATVFLAAPVKAVESPAVEMVRVQTHPGYTRVVLETNAPIEPNLFTLGAPDRLVVDLPELQWRIPRPNGPVNSRLVKEYRFGLFQPGVSRLILRLAQPARILGGNRRRSGRGYLYEIDLADLPAGGAALSPASLEVAALPTAPVVDIQTKSAFAKRQFDPDKAEFSALQLAIHEALGSKTPEGEPDPEVQTAMLSPADQMPSAAGLEAGAPSREPDTPAPAGTAAPAGPLRIVLDPGHGGIDPGTGAAHGVEEKTINLAFALQLRDLLADNEGYEVFMTRESDKRVGLANRVQIARQHNADLFISIHADWSDNASAKGATAYTLSEEASVEALESIANGREAMGEVAGVDLAAQREDVARLLVDLARRETQARSLKFAEIVIDEVSKETDVIRRPIRRNSFRVLKAPDMPSVLLELGFVSNEEDRTKLISPLWRLKTAEAVERAIIRWHSATATRDFANR